MSGPGPGSITVDQLIALSDEMAALVRAGVPLDQGLVAAGRDLKGRLGQVAGGIGGRVEQGEGLAEALDAGGAALPRFYRAVIEAGVRSGRLARAIEGLADYARGFAETRRAIGMALIYPMLVLLLAWGLFVGFVALVAPRLASTFEVMRVGETRSMDVLVWLREHLAYWAWIGPVVVAAMGVGWVLSGRAMALRPGRLAGGLRLVPGMGSILSLAQTADFADLIALMIDHGTPLDEAIGLAAEATGSASLGRSAATLIEATRRGDPPDEAATQCGLPPMLAWILGTSGARGSLAPALRQAAATYRARSRRKAEFLQAILPTVVVAAVGLSAGFVYALAVFRPLVSLWYGLAVPVTD